MSGEWLYFAARIQPENVDALAGLDGLEVARALAPVLGQTVLVTDVYLGRDEPWQLRSGRPTPVSHTAAKVEPDGTAVQVTL